MKKTGISRTGFRKVNGLGLLAVCLVAAVSQRAVAGLLRVESDSLFSTYRGEDLALKAPLIEFFEAHYTEPVQRLRLSGNFSVHADPSNRDSEFNLYTLDGSYEVIPDTMRVTLGRTFNTFSTIRPSVMDSVQSEFYFFEKRLTFGAYAGVERKFEALGRPTQVSNAYGGFATYRESNIFPLTLGTRIEHISTDEKGADVASLTVFQPLPGAVSPELTAVTEWNITENHSNRTEAGVDIYPTHRSNLGLHFLTYDLASPERASEPIFRIFSQGRLNEVTASLGYQFESGLSTSLALSYDRYVIQQDQIGEGKKSELGFGFGWGQFQINNFTYYVASYGGFALGDRVRLNWKGPRRWEAFGLMDFVSYEKVTSSKRTALNAQIGASTWFQNSFRFEMVSEANNNNIDRDDFRFFARLTYLLWQET